VTDNLPSYLLRNWKPHHKGVSPWTWPPVAHAAPQDLAPGAQPPAGAAQRRTAPRARRHFGGRARRAPAGGGTPPARLPGDAESVHARNRGIFTFVEQLIVALAFIGGFLYAVRSR